jgi:tRNA(Arg) A34 adenosine deaminase TadA
MIRRMLAVIENEVLPKTERGVAAGNKVFGAAVLDGRHKEMPTVIAETNHETLCPMYHGEVYTIKQWSEKISAIDRPSPADSIFLSTHEPCCMCISAIVWSGFKKVFYFFPYEASRDQGIPHDINIMQELWQVPRYAPCNKFCTSVGLLDVIEECQGEDLEEFRIVVKRITEKYEELARKYHAEKTSNPNNTLAFN